MIGIGVIGCGKISQVRHLPEYAENPGARLVGYYDLNGERASRMAEQYGGTAYGALEELLEDPQIDAVSVCTANNCLLYTSIGGIMIDPMKKAGYSGTEAAAVTASSASLGIIIPPSIPMVVFATTASVSVGSLFMAGVIPGIILCIAFCIMHGFRFGHVETPTKEKLTVREAVTTFWDAIFALGMPVIILGGIYGGFFTPTAAAAVSCVYALVVGCFIYRNLSAKQLSLIHI